jgi:hypothetical protein
VRWSGNAVRGAAAIRKPGEVKTVASKASSSNRAVQNQGENADKHRPRCNAA